MSHERIKSQQSNCFGAYIFQDALDFSRVDCRLRLIHDRVVDYRNGRLLTVAFVAVFNILQPKEYIGKPVC